MWEIRNHGKGSSSGSEKRMRHCCKTLNHLTKSWWNASVTNLCWKLDFKSRWRRRKRLSGIPAMIQGGFQEDLSRFALHLCQIIDYQGEKTEADCFLLFVSERQDKSVQVNNARRSLNDQNDTPLANQCRESEAEVQELEERLQYLSARRKQLLDEIDRMEEDVAAMQSVRFTLSEKIWWIFDLTQHVF